jgi:hypothetical protein
MSTREGRSREKVKKLAYLGQIIVDPAQELE